MTNTAEALVVRVPTASDALNDLVRKRWVSEGCSVTDTRVVHVRLSRRGEALTRQVEQRVSQANAMLAEEGHNALGLTPRGRCT